MTEWLRARKYKGFLGEIGAATTDDCLRGLDGILGHLDGNADVWLGWTYWTAGPWWPESYEFGVEPRGDGWPARATALRAAFAARLGKR
jgi:endoglucanase